MDSQSSQGRLLEIDCFVFLRINTFIPGGQNVKEIHHYADRCTRSYRRRWMHKNMH